MELGQRVFLERQSEALQVDVVKESFANPVDKARIGRSDILLIGPEQAVPGQTVFVVPPLWVWNWVQPVVESPWITEESLAGAFGGEALLQE